MILPEYDRDAARVLIKEKDGFALSASDTAARAHRRSDLKRPEEAALLFCLAADRAQAEHAAEPSRPNQAINYAVRAGFAFNRAGEHGVAEPLLRQAIDYDWVGQGLNNDTHMVEWAFYHLLINARDDRERFANLFEEAVTRSAAVGRDFTMIQPHQEALLEIAVALENHTIIDRLADKIKSRRPGKKDVKDLLRRAEALAGKKQA